MPYIARMGKENAGPSSLDSGELKMLPSEFRPKTKQEIDNQKGGEK